MSAQIKQLPLNVEAAERLEKIGNHSRFSVLNIALAAIPVAVTASLNIAGGALLGYDLSKGSVVATVFGGFIGCVFEVGIIHGYLNAVRMSRLWMVHAASAAALIAGMTHMASMSVDQAVTNRQQKAVVYAEMAEISAMLGTITAFEKAIDDKSKAINLLKNKRVKGGTVWEKSEGCTKTNHPSDCATIANLGIDLQRLTEQKPNKDKQALQSRLDELKAANPESRLAMSESSVNQAKLAEQSIDKSIFEKVRDAISPSMSINLLLLTTCSIIAIVLQQILANVLKPFSTRKNSLKRESSGIKDESSQGEKVNQGIFGNFLRRGDLAIRWAESYGQRKAELEHKSQKEGEQKTAIAQRAVLDISTYLKNMGANEAVTLLMGKSLLDGLKEEKRVQLSKAVTWVIRKYEADQPINLRVLANDIAMETNSAFINYSYLQRNIQDVMIKLGLWVNQGSENRARIAWASEEEAVKKLKGE